MYSADHVNAHNLHVIIEMLKKNNFISKNKHKSFNQYCI